MIELSYTADEPIRIDVFLSQDILRDLSRNEIQHHIKDFSITVNNKHIKPSYILMKKDHITIDIPEKKAIRLQAEDIPLDILYEDREILIINKAAGMVVHPSFGHPEGTLVHGLLNHTSLSTIGEGMRPGIVHRLDKDTGGIMVVAKTDDAHLSLQAQFKARGVKREYAAFVSGRVKNQVGEIEICLGRHPKERQKMAVMETGRWSKSYYEVISYHQKITYVKVGLVTGRTHQIRVHMAHIHHPIVGDMVYGNKKALHNMPYQALYAKKLGFFHPKTKKYMEFTHDLPAYMERLLSIPDIS